MASQYFANWEDRSDYIAACANQQQPNKPWQWDWHIENMPAVIYELYPSNSEAWERFRLSKRPKQKLDAYGDPMFEKWPRKDDRGIDLPARPLLDFPILPDQIGTEEELWYLEAIRRVEPRITWEDIVMRMEMTGNLKKHSTERGFINSALNNQAFRNLRPIFSLVAWHTRGRNPKPLPKTEMMVLDRLTPWHIDNNTTRGLTPGLIDPDGEDIASNRVPLPIGLARPGKMIRGSHKPRKVGPVPVAMSKDPRPFANGMRRRRVSSPVASSNMVEETPSKRNKQQPQQSTKQSTKQLNADDEMQFVPDRIRCVNQYEYMDREAPGSGNQYDNSRPLQNAIDAETDIAIDPALLSEESSFPSAFDSSIPAGLVPTWPLGVPSETGNEFGENWEFMQDPLFTSSLELPEVQGAQADVNDYNFMDWTGEKQETQLPVMEIDVPSQTSEQGDEYIGFDLSSEQSLIFDSANAPTIQYQLDFRADGGEPSKVLPSDLGGNFQEWITDDLTFASDFNFDEYVTNQDSDLPWMDIDTGGI